MTWIIGIIIFLIILSFACKAKECSSAEVGIMKIVAKLMGLS